MTGALPVAPESEAFVDARVRPLKGLAESATVVYGVDDGNLWAAIARGDELVVIVLFGCPTGAADGVIRLFGTLPARLRNRGVGTRCDGLL